MVVAFVALFVAIGGSSYAVTRLPARSVGAKQLKRGAVRNAHIANNAVTGAKVKNGSLTAADIQVASLAGVASAASATNATNATHSALAGALDRVVYVRTAAAVPPGPTDPNAPATVGGASAPCPPGTFVVGGGVGVDDNTATSVVDSFPEPGGRAWTARVDNSDPGAAHGFTVISVCIPATAAG
jgi:hypothetical protein